MFFELALVAAQVGSITVPAETGVRDYPSWAIREEKQTGAVVSYWVNPEGRVYNCELLHNIGDEELASEVCKVIERARFDSPTDVSGAPIAAHYVSFLRMILPGTVEAKEIASKRLLPDAEFEVNALPKEFADGYTSTVAVQVDTNGIVTDCVPTSEGNTTLDNLACKQVLGIERLLGTDKSGEIISYVRTLKVKFVTGPEQ